MAIIKKENFTDFQNVNVQPQDTSAYSISNLVGKWVIALLKKKVVPNEGDYGPYYLLYEIEEGNKKGYVVAPDPPFGTGNGPN